LRDFRELTVWQKAHRLTLDVYSATTNFPRDEMYGLTSQIRRCAASIPANIAEGCGKFGQAEFARYLLISSGSASELDYHLLLTRDLGYLDGSHYQALADALNEVRRMLTAMIKTSRTDRNGRPLTAKG
jgi:four helix bundle protein